MVRLDEMARQNAVPAEQGSTAAVRLTDQARCLSASLADYRLLPA